MLWTNTGSALQNINVNRTYWTFLQGLFEEQVLTALGIFLRLTWVKDNGSTYIFIYIK